MDGNELLFVSRLMRALDAYRRHLVVIGGTGHYLYQFHPLARPTWFPILRTEDADIAIQPSLPSHARLEDALVEAGFEAKRLGQATPPVSHYHCQVGSSAFYAEFLINLDGPRMGRDDRARETAEVGTVIAQRARYVDILLQEPWVVELPESAPPLAVQVVNPAGFMLQKILIQDDRRWARDRYRDLLYLHDTLLIFWDALDQLRAPWERAIATLPPKTRRRLIADFESRLLGKEMVLGTVGIARDQGREFTPEEFRERVAFAMAPIAGLLP